MVSALPSGVPCPSSEGTEGSSTRVEAVFQKGTDPQFDSYSGFFDNGHRKATRLDDYLKARGESRRGVLKSTNLQTPVALAFEEFVGVP
jgi:nicotinamidase-related amidase